MKLHPLSNNLGKMQFINGLQSIQISLTITIAVEEQIVGIYFKPHLI